MFCILDIYVCIAYIAISWVWNPQLFIPFLVKAKHMAEEIREDLLHAYSQIHASTKDARESHVVNEVLPSGRICGWPLVECENGETWKL